MAERAQGGRNLPDGLSAGSGRVRQDGYGAESSRQGSFDLPVVRSEGQSPHRYFGVVENGGFGASAALPIASLLEEYYLTDTVTRPWLVEMVKQKTIYYPAYGK